MKTHITLQVPLTKADIFPKSDHFNLPGNVNTNFIQIMCEKEIGLHRKLPYFVQKIVCVHGKQLKNGQKSTKI